MFLCCVPLTPSLSLYAICAAPFWGQYCLSLSIYNLPIITIATPYSAYTSRLCHYHGTMQGKHGTRYKCIRTVLSFDKLGCPWYFMRIDFSISTFSLLPERSTLTWERNILCFAKLSRCLYSSWSFVSTSSLCLTLFLPPLSVFPAWSDLHSIRYYMDGTKLHNTYPIHKRLCTLSSPPIHACRPAGEDKVKAILNEESYDVDALRTLFKEALQQ